jgi:hypothetical protein
VRFRRNVLTQYHDRLKEEAPYAYKDITPVVETSSRPTSLDGWRGCGRC